MPKSILEVRGIGPSTAKVLAEMGIMTADDLAGKMINQVTKINGFSTIRAEKVIADAKALFAADDKTKPIEKKKLAKKKGGKNKKKGILKKGGKKKAKKAKEPKKAAKKTKKTGKKKRKKSTKKSKK